MDLVTIIQGIIGIVLFFASGYASSLVFFSKDELDLVDRTAYSITFALTIPALIIFFLNFILKVPINYVTVVLVFVAITVGSLYYSNNYAHKKHHRS